MGFTKCARPFFPRPKPSDFIIPPTHIWRNAGLQAALSLDHPESTLNITLI
jgi:hypothetical protein